MQTAEHSTFSLLGAQCILESDPHRPTDDFVRGDVLVLWAQNCVLLGLNQLH